MHDRRGALRKIEHLSNVESSGSWYGKKCWMSLLFIVAARRRFLVQIMFNFVYGVEWRPSWSSWSGSGRGAPPWAGGCARRARTRASGCGRETSSHCSITACGASGNLERAKKQNYKQDILLGKGVTVVCRDK